MKKVVFVVVDCFGFPWGDVVEDLTEAQRQLNDIREDCTRRGWDSDDLGFMIETRNEG